MAHDDYLPTSNPGGTLGVFLYADTKATVAAGGAAWDRGNRGPITALSKHHVACDANTVFAYYSRGGYIYSETDEVLRVDGVVLHQATQALPRFDQVRRWATWFPAMGVDIGVPDIWRRHYPLAANGSVGHQRALAGGGRGDSAEESALRRFTTDQQHVVHQVRHRQLRIVIVVALIGPHKGQWASSL
ncbi:MAG: hypothetical protein RLZZ373_1708 [Pseudomonadota bacterium]|jgi:hypothetical protein